MLRSMWNPFKTKEGASTMAGNLPISFGNGRNLDLQTLPHLLVGGMIGSGKSVFLHNLLIGLISENTVERLRLILCDDKQVEFEMYNSIPHLLTPVITDSKKVILAFRWLNKEIDRRYSVLSEKNFKDIDAYHHYLDIQTSNSIDSEKAEAMPFIVTVVDELSDVMNAHPKEFEPLVARVAQRGARAGVHVVIATSIPSSKVLSNSIKMNIPARVTFQVTSESDSRAILGTNGAENLRGTGNALLITRDSTGPERIHVSDIKVDVVLKNLQKIREDYSVSDIDDKELVPVESFWTEGSKSIFLSDFADDDDELYPEAVRVVREAGKASTSYMQRKMGIGYARAARLMDLLEQGGVIGPTDGAKPREVISHETN